MKPGELKIYYKDTLSPELELALVQCLAYFGYKRWAGGWDFAEGVRDLAFDKGEADEAANKLEE